MTIVSNIKDNSYKNTAIEIPDDLKHILKDIIIKKNLLVLILGLDYNGKPVIETIKDDWTKFKKNIRTSLKEKYVNSEHITKIINLIQDNYEKIYPENTISERPKEIPKIERPNISQEEWKTKLAEKYDIVNNVCNTNFPHIWPTFEFALSIKNILHVQDITLPFAGIILGPPSSSKTLVLEMLRDLELTFYTDNFTPRSFVSHNTSVPEEQLQNIDMLPKIKNRILITPELGPIFAAKDEDLTQNLSIFTRIVDGHGYESDSGAYGHRGYKEDIMFTWIGAAVDMPRRVYKQLGYLGPKLYFFRIPYIKRSFEDYVEELKLNNFTERKKQVKEALMDYLNWFNLCPVDNSNSLPISDIELVKIEWNSSKDNIDVLNAIVRLGELLASLRGVTVTWDTKNTGGSDYGYSTPTKEIPKRAMDSLINLAKGHALLTGRNYLTMDDVPILIKTVLSTAPLERVLIFDLLLNTNGILTRPQIQDFLKISRPTTLKTMIALDVLGLVDFTKEEENNNNLPAKITLKKEFDWFLSDEFKKLSEGYTPGSMDDVINTRKKSGVKKSSLHLPLENLTNQKEIDPELQQSDSLLRSIEEIADDDILSKDLQSNHENSGQQSYFKGCKENLPPPTTELLESNNDVQLKVESDKPPNLGQPALPLIINNSSIRKRTDNQIDERAPR